MTSLNAQLGVRKYLKKSLYSLTGQIQPLELPNKILIGTHHKTGTVWFNSIFKEIAFSYDLHYVKDKASTPPPGYDIYFQDHNRFDLAKIATDYRGLHIIRDPRDVLVSACYYHQKSDEPWLHLPQDEFGGQSYHQAINALPDLNAKFLFEMQNSSGRIINQMTSWDYDNPDFIEMKYEDLIEDVNLKLFHEIFSFLGFSGKQIPRLLQIAWDNSLFSGNKDGHKHVRSGASKQWPKHFNSVIKANFVDCFGDCLIKLGYEEDNNWTVND